MANASTIAGMAFANAFLGICHSMAHKLGAFHNLPHGIANSLLINEVMKFNISERPTKMGAFSQYEYPDILERYVEVANFIGITGKDDMDTFNKLLDAIDDLKDKIGIKKTIKEYGIEEKAFLESLDEMVEQVSMINVGANPRYPLMSELKKCISELIMERK